MEPNHEHIMQFFAHAHLPPHLAEVSRPFGEMAERIVVLEAKDAAVRALLAK